MNKIHGPFVRGSANYAQRLFSFAKGAPSVPRQSKVHRDCWSGRGGWYGWKPSSSSNFSVRAFRAYPLIEIRQTVPCRAIRGNSISVNSTLPLLVVQPKLVSAHPTSCFPPRLDTPGLLIRGPPVAFSPMLRQFLYTISIRTKHHLFEVSYASMPLLVGAGCTRQQTAPRALRPRCTNILITINNNTKYTY